MDFKEQRSISEKILSFSMHCDQYPYAVRKHIAPSALTRGASFSQLPDFLGYSPFDKWPNLPPVPRGHARRTGAEAETEFQALGYALCIPYYSLNKVFAGDWEHPDNTQFIGPGVFTSDDGKNEGKPFLRGRQSALICHPFAFTMEAMAKWSGINGQNDLSPVFVAEGYATAASIAAVVTPHRVLCAGNAGNMEKVALSIRAFTDAPIVFCLDNDSEKGEKGKGNRGITAGIKLLSAWSRDFYCIYPSDSAGTDFNDALEFGDKDKAAALLRPFINGPLPKPQSAVDLALGYTEEVKPSGMTYKNQTSMDILLARAHKIMEENRIMPIQKAIIAADNAIANSNKYAVGDRMPSIESPLAYRNLLLAVMHGGSAYESLYDAEKRDMILQDWTHSNLKKDTADSPARWYFNNGHNVYTMRRDRDMLTGISQDVFSAFRIVKKQEALLRLCYCYIKVKEVKDEEMLEEAFNKLDKALVLFKKAGADLPSLTQTNIDKSIRGDSGISVPEGDYFDSNMSLMTFPDGFQYNIDVYPPKLYEGNEVSCRSTLVSPIPGPAPFFDKALSNLGKSDEWVRSLLIQMAFALSPKDKAKVSVAWLYGLTHCFKSTPCDILTKILGHRDGKYVKEAGKSYHGYANFTDGDDTGAARIWDTADGKDARLIIYKDIKEDGLDWHLLKTRTGESDGMTGRVKNHEKTYIRTPIGQFISSNNLPKMPSDSQYSAFRSRLAIFHFDRNFAPDGTNPELFIPGLDEKLEKELPAIFDRLLRLRCEILADPELKDKKLISLMCPEVRAESSNVLTSTLEEWCKNNLIFDSEKVHMSISEIVALYNLSMPHARFDEDDGTLSLLQKPNIARSPKSAQTVSVIKEVATKMSGRQDVFYRPHNIATIHCKVKKQVTVKSSAGYFNIPADMLNDYGDEVRCMGEYNVVPPGAKRQDQEFRHRAAAESGF